MKKLFAFILLCLMCTIGVCQTPRKAKKTTIDGLQELSENDTINKKSKSRGSRGGTKPDSVIVLTIADYKERTMNTDWSPVDTTFTIQNYYKANHLNQDLFGYNRFPNIGQGLVPLTYKSRFTSSIPRLGYYVSQQEHKEIDQIKYYDVKTPMTEFRYFNGYKKGQSLVTQYTQNINPRLNFNIEYHGLISQGRYDRSFANRKQLVFSTNYTSKNKRHYILAHYNYEQFNNQQNGGLIDEAEFEGDDPNFDNSENLNVSLNDASSVFYSQRLFYKQGYRLIQKDSVKTPILDVNYQYYYEYKNNKYNQSTEEYYTSDYITNELFASSGTITSNHRAGIELRPLSGFELDAGVNYHSLQHFFPSELLIPPAYMQNNFSSNIVRLDAKANIRSKWLDVSAQGDYNLVSTDYKDAYTFQIKLGKNIGQDKRLELTASAKSNYPDFSQQRHQGFLENFNWEKTFNRTNDQQLNLDFYSKKWANISVQANRVENMLYYGNLDDDFVIDQFDGTVEQVSVKANRNTKIFFLNWDNTIQYQKVLSGKPYLRLPQLIARSTLYVQGRAFEKRPLHYQIGFGGTYYSKFYQNGFLPLTQELYLQNNKEYGGYPNIDFFFNGSVKNMRFYLKAEHLNEFWSPRNYYVLPSLPTTGFIVRLGVVWNIFT